MAVYNKCKSLLFSSWVLMSIISQFMFAMYSVCEPMVFEEGQPEQDLAAGSSFASSSSSFYVDPSDMGSYSHSLQRNIANSNRQIQDHPKYTHGDGQSMTRENSDEIECISKKKTTTSISDVDEPSKYIPSGICEPSPSCQELPAVMIYTKRIVASLLRQLNVRNYQFGPKEAITIDLQAELSYEDFMKLNKFILNTNSSGDDAETEISVTTQLAVVTDIIGNLLHVVYPQPSVSFIEYVSENINFHYFSSLKFWIYLVTGMTVVFIVGLFLQRIYISTHPMRSLFYCFLIFYMISCIVVFYDLYETAKSENRARLFQYDKMPKDCDYNNFGLLDSVGYYFRVHILKHKDQCYDYYKRMAGDKFFHVAPVEAISEALSRLVFHPMEYIGDKLGKFFGGLVAEIPFWLKPFLLILVFLFGFLAIFRYRITTPFLCIEPIPSTPMYLEGPLERHDQAQQAIIERPPLGEVVRTSAGIDVSTSTDDLEDYINGRGIYLSHQSTNNINSPWKIVVQNYIWVFITFILYYLNILLRQVPEDDDFLRNQDDDVLFEHFFQDAHE